jgi:hypothetical protein
MKTHSFVTAAAFIEALESAGLHYAKMDLENGHFIVVTELWGKIFGPFENCDDTGALWLSNVVLDRTAFEDMIRTKGWCVGGDRVWLAPEVQYNIPNRFTESEEGGYSLPAQIDPGTYSMDSSKTGSITLVQDMDLQLHNTASGRKKLRLERTVKPSSNPLRHVADFEQLSKRVSYSGYTQEIELTDLTPDDAMSETWNLIQLHPGGTVMIPTAGTAVYQDYYDPIGQTHFRLTGNCAYFKITGRHQYKVGLKATGVFGRIGYFLRDEDGTARLIVRNFNSNPSFPYIDEPMKSPGKTGDSVQIYNDDGGLGGFGEIEVQGCAVGGGTGRSSSIDSLDLWCFAGLEEHVWEVAYRLLGLRNIYF